MAARRLVIVMLVMLGIASLMAALAEPLEEDEDEPATTAPRPVPAPSGALVKARIEADQRPRSPIELRVGDQLELTVRSRRPDQVEIPAIGELRFVGPFAPARFDFLAWEEATYAVRLVEADRLIARIEVRAADPGSHAGPTVERAARGEGSELDR